MTMVSDYVLDAALVKYSEATDLHLCSAEPVVYGDVATYSLAVKSSPAINAAEDASPSGRKRVIAAITDGVINTTGSATHWALIDSGNTRILATGDLSGSASLVAGEVFTLGAIDLRFPDAVSA